MKENLSSTAAPRRRRARLSQATRRVAQVAAALILVATLLSPAAARRGGILGQRAPALGVSTWFNLPAGKSSVDLADLKGKVIVLFFFQSW